VGLAALDNWDADRLHFLHAARSMRAAMTFLPQVRFQPGWGIDWITSVCSVQLPDGAADAVEHALEALDIQTRRWWSEGCQTNPAFADCPRQDLSVTNVLGHSVIGLPFAIDMDDRDISRVAATLATALAGL
jgi:dTDP-4-amino-4,6-dideoxygalactose transaminase